MTPLYFGRIKCTVKATIHDVIQFALELLINVFQCPANSMDFTMFICKCSEHYNKLHVFSQIN